MNENQRQAYLQHLGIDSYQPRWILPGAPSPQACVMPVETVNIKTTTRSVNATPAATATAALKSPLVVLDECETKVSKSQSSKIKKPITVAPVPHFALTIWRISVDLLVVDTREAQLALPTDQLLVNIVAALGYQLPQLPKAEILRWPLLTKGTGLESIDHQGEDQAREMIHAFLDTQLTRQAAKHLLAMGREAARYLLDEARPFEEIVGSSAAITSLSVTAVVVPSLAMMLQDPLQKAITWRAIQPLRQR